MILANVKDLKSGLNRYLRLAEAGKVIVVTRRGKVIAEVHPAREQGSGRRGKRPIEEVMTSLAEQGLVDLPKRTGAVGLKPGIRVKDARAALRILDRLSEERKRR
jgi:antitoxin (DNA-binding transcriptional repressor) of toxin-antitoxin stability system